MSLLTMDMHIGRPVKILIGAVLLLLVGVGLVFPLFRQQKAMGRKIERAKTEYMSAVVVAEQYKALSHSTKHSVLLQEPLFSYIDKVTRKLNLTKRIDYVRPENKSTDDGSTIEAVHVAFKGITLHEFVRFLHYVEVQKREIFVKAISIKKDANRNLNMQMTLQKRT